MSHFYPFFSFTQWGASILPMKSLLHVGFIGHSFESLSPKGSGVCFLSDREAYAVWGSFLSCTEKRCKEEIVYFPDFIYLVRELFGGLEWCAAFMELSISCYFLDCQLCEELCFCTTRGRKSRTWSNVTLHTICVKLDWFDVRDLQTLK